MAGVALHVHNGINTYGVGIRTGGSTDNDNLAPEMLTYVLVRIRHGHHIGFHFRNIDRLVVNGMGTTAITVEERKSRRQLLVVNDRWILHSHLLDELFCRFNSLGSTRNG